MNWKESLCGSICRLRYVIRWSNCRRTHDESVAEHVHFTTYYAMLIANYLQSEEGENIDYQRLYESAITHDDEEALTGDIPRSFKHSTFSVRVEINQASRTAHNKLIDSLDLSPSVRRHMSVRWKGAKDVECLEGQIVAFADFLSVLSYLYQEMEAGNTGVLEDRDTFLAYYEGFRSQKFERIRKVVAAVGLLVIEVANAMSVH